MVHSTFTEFFAATAASAAGLIGLLFVALDAGGDTPGPARRVRPARDPSGRLIFTLAVGFALQTAFGVLVVIDPHARGWLGGLAALQVGSLVLGIGRTWEIVGVRDPGIRASMRLLKRRGR